MAGHAATAQPFKHLAVQGLLDQADQDALTRDFPEPKKAGFFPIEELRYGPAFRDLLNELQQPEFSRIVGNKLGIDLVDRPKMIVVRKWSAARDGRPHTDGVDKAATALVYLNDDWKVEEGGALRFLDGPDLDGPGSAPIPARYGSLAAFARSDTSWHGHKPFVGERRVIQVFWLVDEAAAGRKQKRHRWSKFLRVFSKRA